MYWLLTAIGIIGAAVVGRLVWEWLDPNPITTGSGVAPSQTSGPAVDPPSASVEQASTQLAASAVVAPIERSVSTVHFASDVGRPLKRKGVLLRPFSFGAAVLTGVALGHGLVNWLSALDPIAGVVGILGGSLGGYLSLTGGPRPEDYAWSDDDPATHIRPATIGEALTGMVLGGVGGFLTGVGLVQLLIPDTDNLDHLGVSLWMMGAGLVMGVVGGGLVATRQKSLRRPS